MRTFIMSTVEIASSVATVPNTTPAPARYSRPPSVGPAIVQTWKTDELTAVAFANNSGRTRLGTSACAEGIANARVTPNSVITANTGLTERTANTENASRAI